VPLLNRALYQTSAGRPTSSRQGHSRQQSSDGSGQYERPTRPIFGMRGALPVMPGRNAPREEHPTPSTLPRANPPIPAYPPYLETESTTSMRPIVALTTRKARPSRVAWGQALQRRVPTEQKTPWDGSYDTAKMNFRMTYVDTERTAILS